MVYDVKLPIIFIIKTNTHNHNCLFSLPIVKSWKFSIDPTIFDRMEWAYGDDNQYD